VVIACGLKADEHRATVRRQSLDETIIIGLGAQNGEPPAAGTAGNLDEHFMAVLGNINGYQGGRSQDRVVLGHGRSASSVCSAISQ
jgi:hypothetical protein